jgi:hypothetical protein
MAAANYEYADVSSNEPVDQMTYYRHHRNKDDPPCAWTDVQSENSGGGKEKDTDISVNFKNRKKYLKET